MNQLRRGIAGGRQDRFKPAGEADREREHPVVQKRRDVLQHMPRIEICRPIDGCMLESDPIQLVTI